MWEYFAANCAPDEFDKHQPRHHVFHFCDIAIAKDSNLGYSEDKPGCGPHDIVHMLDYCATVLSGKASTNAPGKNVTKTVALVMMVHLMGDLHQPLHVGSEYFLGNGTKADPALNKNARGDRGGNEIQFYGGKFHGQWDSGYVSAAVTKWKKDLELQKTADLPTLASAIVSEPGQPDINILSGVELRKQLATWAEESVRISQDAHERLAFSDINPNGPGQDIASITAKVIGDRGAYNSWAAEQVKLEITRAGLRLAWLIEQSVK